MSGLDLFDHQRTIIEKARKLMPKKPQKSPRKKMSPAQFMRKVAKRTVTVDDVVGTHLRDVTLPKADAQYVAAIMADSMYGAHFVAHNPLCNISSVLAHTWIERGPTDVQAAAVIAAIEQHMPISVEVLDWYRGTQPQAETEAQSHASVQPAVGRKPTVEDVANATGCSVDDVSEAWSGLRRFVTAGIDAEACRVHVQRFIMTKRIRMARWLIDQCGGGQDGYQKAVEAMSMTAMMDQLAAPQVREVPNEQGA